MMYPYLTLNDDTEITHSEVRPDGRVKVYIETPDEKDGFHDATCYLPVYGEVDVTKSRKEKHNPDGTGGAVKKYCGNTRFLL